MPATLLSRNYGGLSVDIIFDGTDKEPNLIVQIIDGDDDPRSANIPSDKVMDAFNHPFCYLPYQPPKRRMPEDGREDEINMPDDNDYNRKVA